MTTAVQPDAGMIRVHRPVDGTVIEELAIDDATKVAEAAARLRAAQVDWERIGVEGRTRWLQRYRAWVLDNADRLGAIMEAESGKVPAEAHFESTILLDGIDSYRKTAPKLLKPKHVRGSSPLMLGKRYTVVRSPFPLVGVIGGWNFSLLLTLGDAVPALYAGAAVLVKPSEFTPLVVREAVRGWREIGAPPVLEMVVGGGDTGTALTDAVDYVMFTGSAATGKRVAQRAAETTTPVSLELGGKDPAIVLRSADVKRAANCAVYGAFANNGQMCISLERFYVEAPIYEEFVERVVAKVNSLRSGTDLGAMTTARQVEIVDEHVRDAVAKGARVLTGGTRRGGSGNWYEPTVLVDVDHTMKVMTEETFGPVLPIMKVADAEEAVRLANDSPYGLSSSVFAGANEEGERIAALIDAGAVNINDYAVSSMSMTAPMGGWKQSGIGSRSGDHGLLKYTRVKVITAPRLPVVPANELFWFPYTTTRTGLIRRGARLIYGKGKSRFRGTP
jgi:acyl-CoA reductase-like NAD-dependent aldehyde dehydrogenase